MHGPDLQLRLTPLNCQVTSSILPRPSRPSFCSSAVVTGAKTSADRKTACRPINKPKLGQFDSQTIPRIVKRAPLRQKRSEGQQKSRGLHPAALTNPGTIKTTRPPTTSQLLITDHQGATRRIAPIASQQTYLPLSALSLAFATRLPLISIAESNRISSPSSSCPQPSCPRRARTPLLSTPTIPRRVSQTMKGFSMNKVLGTIKKRPTFSASNPL